MADYRDDDTRTVVVERRGGFGRTIAILVVIAIIIVAILFLTGFWSADVTKKGSLPSVDVSAKGGSLPKVDLDSKKLVVGTTQTKVDVPTVETKKETISVPAVGVTEGKTDKKQ